VNPSRRAAVTRPRRRVGLLAVVRSSSRHNRFLRGPGFARRRASLTLQQRGPSGSKDERGRAGPDRRPLGRGRTQKRRAGSWSACAYAPSRSSRSPRRWRRFRIWRSAGVSRRSRICLLCRRRGTAGGRRQCRCLRSKPAPFKGGSRRAAAVASDQQSGRCSEHCPSNHRSGGTLVVDRSQEGDHAPGDQYRADRGGADDRGGAATACDRVFEPGHGVLRAVWREQVAEQG